MLHGEHSAILSTFIKLPFVIKIFALFIFERPFYTGFTVIIMGTNSMFLLRDERKISVHITRTSPASQYATKIGLQCSTGVLNGLFLLHVLLISN